MKAAVKGSLVRFGINGQAGYLLVCFPHAGGSVAPYSTWSIPGVEVGAVCYPGRDRRIGEPCATDLVRLAEGIARDLHHVELPLALFGHSMGAPIALETARALEAAGRPVAHLFASGSRQAPLPPPSESEPVGTDQDLIRSIVDIGGTDAALMHDAAFAELVLPYLRADVKMFNSYVMALEPRLHCPVTTMVGDQDFHADRRPWDDVSSCHHEYVVRGDHFYLFETPPLDLVAAGLNLTATESDRPR